MARADFVIIQKDGKLRLWKSGNPQDGPIVYGQDDTVYDLRDTGFGRMVRIAGRRWSTWHALIT